MPKLTKDEQETIIRFDESAKFADVYTCSKKVCDRLLKKGFPMLPTDPWGWRARSVPLKAIAFRSLESVTKAQNAAKLRAKGTDPFAAYRAAHKSS